MSSCCCSLAGTAACKTCSNNPFAETPPPVRTYTVSVTDPVLITGQKTNADHIRGMTDEELAEWVWGAESSGRAYGVRGKNAWLNWLKAPVEEGKT